MKAIVLYEDLNKALGNAARIVSGRGQLPVLANVLIESDSDGVLLSATNMEMGIRIGVGGKVEEPGSITVPAKNLFEFVSTLPTGNISLVSEGDKLKIGSGKFGGTFTGISAAEFPVMPKLGNKNKDLVKVDKEVLAEIAKEVIYAAATDESRPVLTGIQFKVDGEKLIVTATDGFRLSRRTFKNESNSKGWGGGLILPAKALAELSRLISEGRKEEVGMEIVEGSNQVVFGYGQVQLISRVLGGNFPDVDKIIPTDYTSKVIIDKTELVSAVRAAAVFARDSSNIVKLAIVKDEMKITAVSQMMGESESEIEVQLEGEGGAIAFNYRYLLDFLGSTDEERVVLLMNGSMSPGVWRGDKNEDLVHLIMPVRV